jgi:hypothetical protein
MGFGRLFIIDTSSNYSWILNYSKDSSQCWFDQICAQLASLQFDQYSILNKEFTMLIYKVCTTTNLTCTHHILQMTKILNFQMCHLLSNCLKTAWKLNT